MLPFRKGRWVVISTYISTILCFHRFFFGTDHQSFWDNSSLPFPVNWKNNSLEQFSDASLETSRGFGGCPEFPNVLNFSKRRHPYSVVLFDEMEKAHPQVGPRHGDTWLGVFFGMAF